MTEQRAKSALITGANTGLGKALARQLALREDFDRIYLGCRNPAKAELAKTELPQRRFRIQRVPSHHRPVALGPLASLQIGARQHDHQSDQPSGTAEGRLLPA